MKHGKEAERIPGFLLWQVSKLWQRHLTIAFRELGLTPTQIILLGNVVRLTTERQRVTQTLLSEVTKVDVMTTSSVIRVLERRQLMRRITNPKDKRAYYIVPTEQGIAKTQQALQKLPGAQEVFFRGVRQNIDQFIDVLQTLIATNEPRKGEVE